MFQPASPDDVPAIVALMNRAYRGAASATAWTTEAAYITGERTSEPLLRAEMAANLDGALLKWAAPDGRVDGCVWLEPVGEGSGTLAR